MTVAYIKQQDNIAQQSACLVLCLSTDAKPTSGITTNHSLIETDTGKVFKWDGDSWAEVAGAGGAAWGDITGTLSAQADLQTELDAKAATATISSAAYTLASDYASSTHSISSAAHTFPGGATFLRADGVFATPPGGSSNMSTVKKTAVQSTTTTSTLPLTGLAFDVSSTVSYTFDFGIVYQSAATATGLKLGMTFPAVSTFAATVRIPVAAAGPAGEFQGYIVSSGSFVIASTTPLTGQKYLANIFGVILPSANGVMQITYGTEVAGSAVSTFAGCYGILTTL